MKLSGDYAEDYGLFEYRTVRRKYLTKMIQTVKWNPIFWITLLFTVFSAFGFGVHVYWKFFAGIMFSVLCVLFGGVCIYLCVVSRSKKTWIQLNRLDYAKIAAFCVFILTFQSLFFALSIQLLKIHFMGSDTAWDAFPDQCLTTEGSETILNCVRTGASIPHNYTSPGLDPISPHSYNEDVPTLLSHLTEIVNDHMDCVLLRSTDNWVHFRCISELMGRPSDLGIMCVVLNATNTTNTTDVWVHSQSREGEWDMNENDTRVRLLFSYKMLCDMSTPGVVCNQKG